MRRRALVMALLALPGCSAGDPGEVSMVAGRRFEPVETTVPAGATVTFTNEAEDPHTVTAVSATLPEGAPYFASGGFESEEEARDEVAAGLIRSGGTFAVTLEVPGRYEFYCIPHGSEGMRATILVEG